MGRLTSLGCAALILLGSGVVSAQDRRLERIEANIADVCDARMRCITIVSDELKRRCGRDLACVKEKLDDLRARGQADEVTIADLSRQIDELEALLNAALAAQSSAVPEDNGTPNDVALDPPALVPFAAARSARSPRSAGRAPGSINSASAICAEVIPLRGRRHRTIGRAMMGHKAKTRASLITLTRPHGPGPASRRVASLR